MSSRYTNFEIWIWTFFATFENKIWYAHRFCIRCRENTFNIPKRASRKKELGFTRWSFLRIGKFQKSKKLFQKEESRKIQKIKKIQKIQKLQKKDTEMYYKEDCWLFDFFCFFGFFELFGLFWVFWIFGFFWKFSDCFGFLSFLGFLNFLRFFEKI